MMVNLRLALVLLGALLLLPAPFPAPVASAHWCHTTLPEYSDPTDPDSGCNGADCVGRGYHHHKNDLPPKACHSGRCSPHDWKCCRTHGPPHSHTYGSGGSAGARSDQVTGGDEVGGGVVQVFDSSGPACNGRVDESQFDGDYDSGVGGGFFGYGPWADEPICNYGLAVHGGVVAVNDVVFGTDVWFTIGADDTSGPVISTDPVTGETTCETDGSITPGDPTTDPTADWDDCLTAPQNLAQGSSGTTCGAGGDGGYWVFLTGLLVTEAWGGVSLNNPPTAGTITA